MRSVPVVCCRIECGRDLGRRDLPAYLYFNFSGYMDVVIGVARFFRIALPENFDRPFLVGERHRFLEPLAHHTVQLAKDLCLQSTDDCWHDADHRAKACSLHFGGRLLRDVLSGRNRWHGQTTEFLFFGFLTGGGMAVNKLYQIMMQSRLSRQGYRETYGQPRLQHCARGLTFTWFTFTLLWFWSNWGQIAGFSQALGAVALVLVWAAIFAGATVILATMEAVRRRVLRMTWNGTAVVRSRYVRTSWDTALMVVTVAIVVLLIPRHRTLSTKHSEPKCGYVETDNRALRYLRLKIGLRGGVGDQP